MKKIIAALFERLGYQIKPLRVKVKPAPRNPGEMPDAFYLPGKATIASHQWLRRRNIDTVWDIGANEGQFSTLVRMILPDAAIYAFEPITACFKKMNQHLAGDKNFTAFNYAIGDQTVNQDIFVNDYSLSSSFLPMENAHVESFPYTEKSTAQTVKVDLLKNLLPPAAISGNILCKIDVQGYENVVLQGNADIISKASVVILEVSYHKLYAHQPLFHDIYKMMRELGFEFRGNQDQLVSPVTGEILQADAIFERAGR